MAVHLTHVGGPTTLIEAHGWRILVDPTFDPPGRTYRFGWGTSSTKTVGPTISADDIGPLDLVLLSHDHHADNLDTRGRAVVAGAKSVLTTRAGRRRLDLPAPAGMRPGQTRVLFRAGLPTLSVTATPCRHGPALSRPITGPVIGFVLRWHGRSSSVWVTGDTVLHRRLRAVARTLDVDIAIVHVGAVRFALTGPLRYSMDGRELADLVELVRPRVVVPVHFDGWSHFSEQRRELALALAEVGVPPGLRFLVPGLCTEL